MLYVQTPWWISNSAPPGPERLGFPCKFGQSKFCHSFQVLFAESLPCFGDMMSQVVYLIPEEFALCGLMLQVALPEAIKHNTQALHMLLLHLWEDYHIIPSRLCSTLSSVLLGSSALISEMWLGHCTAQMAYVCIQKILGFPWWNQYTASIFCPLLFAKNPPSSPSRRSILLPVGFQWLTVSGEADRSLSWFWYWAYRSQYKNADLHLSYTPRLLHYTMGFD